jgi:hypothetical protein
MRKNCKRILDTLTSYPFRPLEKWQYDTDSVRFNSRREYSQFHTPSLRSEDLSQLLIMWMYPPFGWLSCISMANVLDPMAIVDDTRSMCGTQTRAEDLYLYATKQKFTQPLPNNHHRPNSQFHKLDKITPTRVIRMALNHNTIANPKTLHPSRLVFVHRVRRPCNLMRPKPSRSQRVPRNEPFFNNIPGSTLQNCSSKPSPLSRSRPSAIALIFRNNSERDFPNRCYRSSPA